MNVALYNGCGIKLENLNGFQKLNSKIGDVDKGAKNEHVNKKREQKRDKSRNKEINKKRIKNKSKAIKYKVSLLGVELAYIALNATSQRCNRCGYTGNRHSKLFKYPHCGNVDHVDVNATFNIALTLKSNS